MFVMLCVEVPSLLKFYISIRIGSLLDHNDFVMVLHWIYQDSVMVFQGILLLNQFVEVSCKWCFSYFLPVRKLIKFRDVKTLDLMSVFMAVEVSIKIFLDQFK